MTRLSNAQARIRQAQILIAAVEAEKLASELEATVQQLSEKRRGWYDWIHLSDSGIFMIYVTGAAVVLVVGLVMAWLQ